MEWELILDRGFSQPSSRLGGWTNGVDTACTEMEACIQPGISFATALTCICFLIE